MSKYHVGSRVDHGRGPRLVVRLWLCVDLHSPMNGDHYDIGDLAGRLNSRNHRWDAVSITHSGVVLGGHPRLVWHNTTETQHRYEPTVDIEHGRPPRLFNVGSGADRGDSGLDQLRPPVDQRSFAVIPAVIVAEIGHLNTCPRHGGQRVSRATRDKLLGLGRAEIGEGAFEVDHSHAIVGEQAAKALLPRPLERD